MGGSREILLVGESRMPTIRLLEQILSRVAQEKGWTLRTRTVAELSSSDIRRRTIPVLARVDTIPIYYQAAMMHRLGIRYWYYLDDNFWELSLDTEVGRYYRHPHVQARVEELVRNADRVLASTPALSDYVSRFGVPTMQLESFFDFSLVPSLPGAPPARSIVRGGFASSSADRAIDLIPVIPELMRSLETHPELELELIGPEYASVPDHPRIRRFPFLPDYESYIRFQIERQWDFALAPLSGSPSNLYKTDNKFREYAALGIPGIYQSSLPYLTVRDGVTGLLVGDDGRSWSEAVDAYLTDPGLREAVRTAARADIERRRSIQAVGAVWSRAFASAPRIGWRAARLRRLMTGRPARPLLHALNRSVPARAVRRVLGRGPAS
ncbi:hypothetical protein [Pseudolysinimonas sp.]|uniref:hypothetical protein n=1 Tax=Pseudolysinimonas sp. TaxID=2680009 RepID=UPI003F80AF5C